jgi:hypothetical protein
MAAGYMLDGRDLIQGKDKTFFLYLESRLVLGEYPPSYPLGTGGVFPGCEADHSALSSAEVKSGGSIQPLFCMYLSCYCLIN